MRNMKRVTRFSSSVQPWLYLFILALKIPNKTLFYVTLYELNKCYEELTKIQDCKLRAALKYSVHLFFYIVFFIFAMSKTISCCENYVFCYLPLLDNKLLLLFYRQ